MAMAMNGCSWAPCGFLLPNPSLHKIRLQVTCKAESTAKQTTSSKKTSVDKKTSEKKNKPQKTSNDEEHVYTIPNMSQWTKNVPPGFGVGKQYDTPLEDEMMADIEKARELRTIAKAKRNEKNNESQESGKTSKPLARITLNGGKVTDKKIDKPVVRKPEQLPDGVRVKVTHLPKKKNITRDLQAAFKDVQGLLHMKPNELANKKTREPLCKGSAILTFATERNAKHFLEKFQGRKLMFGKLEKKVGYELHSKVEVKKPQTGRRMKIRTEEAQGSSPHYSGKQNHVQVSATDAIADAEQESSEDDEEDEGYELTVSSGSHSDINDQSISENTEEYTSSEEEVSEATSSGNVRDEIDGAEVLESVYSEDDETVQTSEEEADEELTPSSTYTMEIEYSEDSEEYDSEDFTSDKEGYEQDGEQEDIKKLVGDGGEYIEVDVSAPLSAKDLDGDAEQIISTSNEKITVLEEQISKLEKKLRRKKSKEIEDEIRKLREEKIEHLERRVFARIVAAREAFRAKRERRLAAAEIHSKKTGTKLQIDEEQMKGVISKHFK